MREPTDITIEGATDASGTRTRFLYARASVDIYDANRYITFGTGERGAPIKFARINLENEQNRRDLDRLASLIKRVLRATRTDGQHG